MLVYDGVKPVLGAYATLRMPLATEPALQSRHILEAIQ